MVSKSFSFILCFSGGVLMVMASSFGIMVSLFHSHPGVAFTADVDELVCLDFSYFGLSSSWHSSSVCWR
jgi:hypothetical protein